jgi:hypothetical protein
VFGEDRPANHHGAAFSAVDHIEPIGGVLRDDDDSSAGFELAQCHAVFGARVENKLVERADWLRQPRVFACDLRIMLKHDRQPLGLLNARLLPAPPG